MYNAKVKCNHGEHRVPYSETIMGSRQGGGSYRRPHRSYDSRICIDCAQSLVDRDRPGVLTVDRWDVSGLRHGLAQHVEGMKAIVEECDACGADVVEGTPHDCPVLGTEVSIERLSS